MKKMIFFALIGLGLASLVSCFESADKLAETNSSLIPTNNISLSSASSSAVNQSSATVNYQLTYSDVVETTLSASDIVVQSAGSASCVKSVSNITTTGATVSFNTCTGNGTVHFYVAAGSARNLAGSSIAASSNSASFTVDNSGVSTASFMILPGLYSAIPSSVDVNFPEVVTAASIAVGDFSIGGSCSGVSISGVVTSGNTTTVSLTGESGCGVGETVAVTALFSGITDALGNSGSGFSVGTYTVTDVGPTSGVFSPATSAITSNLSSFTLTPSGFIDATTVADDDFTISGTCAGVSASGVTVSGSEITVQLAGVGGCTQGQTIIITTDLSGINNLSENAGSGTVSATYTLDAIGPTLTFSIPASTVAVIPSLVDVTFSVDTDMSSVTSADFALSGPCSGASITTVTKLLNVATVQIGGGGTCNNADTLQLNVNLPDIVDSAGNPATGLDSVIYTVDSQGPQATLALSSGSLGTIPNSVSATFDADTDMTTVTAADFSVSGTCGVTLSGITKTGAVATLNLSGNGACTHGQTVVITENFSGVSDVLGNMGVGTQSITLTVDSVGPTGIYSLSNSTLSALPASVDLAMSADTDMDTVTVADFSISGTCGAILNGITLSGNNVTLNLDGTASCTNAQTVILTTNQGSIADVLGNLGSGTIILTLTLDNVGPTVSLSTSTDRYNPLPISISAIFSADTDMSTVTDADFSLSGTCSVSLDSISISGQTATLNLGGTTDCTQEQTMEIAVNPVGVMDATGNAGLNNSIASIHTFDQIGPAATISPLSGVMETLPTSVTVTFDADTDMSTVTAADFAITGTCSVSLVSISKTGNEATLTLSGTGSCAADTTVRVTTVLTGVRDDANNAGVGSQVQIYTQL